jgi:hypothetical protein
MLKLLFGLVLLGALAFAVAFVPLHGRTVLDRWNAAPTASAFLARGWREAKVALGPETEPAKGTRAQAAKPGRPPPRPAAPTEHHSEADRAAIDRIVAESARH